jgi:hypothetical protein
MDFPHSNAIFLRGKIAHTHGNKGNKWLFYWDSCHKGRPMPVITPLKLLRVVDFALSGFRLNKCLTNGQLKLNFIVAHYQ